MKHLPHWKRELLCQWFDADLVMGVELKPAPWWARALMRVTGQGMAALTWRDTIYLKRYPNAEDVALLAHELVHVRQFQKHGVLGFALRYAWQYVACRLHRRPYWEMPLESVAYRRQDEVREELGADRKVRVL